MIKKPSSKDVLKTIQQAIKAGNFDWTSQTGIVIYTPLDDNTKYIVVDFKVTPR